MTTITFQGNPIQTIGNLPSVGSSAPAFTLTKTDLSKITLKDLKGNKVILNIFPSLETPVCGNSVRAFNKKINDIPDAKVICISADLPFAAKRFCEIEQTDNIIHASTFDSPDFGKNFGVIITEGLLRGLMSRAVIVLDKNGKVLYTEQVPEITNEPNYSAAMTALNNA